MRVAVIDYGAGNVRSALRAFEKAADGIGGARVELTARAEDVRAADRIVLPGQGAFADCMAGLSALPDMRAALTESVLKKGTPFFGICVGMQLLAARGLEHGAHDGLGWIDGEVVPLFVSKDTGAGAGAVAVAGSECSERTAEQSRPLKIPHMGWNNLSLTRQNHPLLAGLPADPYVYFVHSYVFRLADPAHELTACDYGGPFTASVVKDNICGTQFHVEKSQKTGLQLIRNFLDWRP